MTGNDKDAGSILANGSSLILPLLRKGKDGHAGLIWERYFQGWTLREGADPETVNHWWKPLQKFVNNFNDAGRTREGLLKERHQRMARTSERWQYASQSRDLPLSWRLTTGLGASHPTENGFSFDPVIGVPYLPGSAVKGLCRRAAELMDASKENIEELFGAEDSGDVRPSQQGRLIFLDAYPATWPTLTVDIVNCHQPTYYRSLSDSNTEKITPPIETESPIPVYFLAVEKSSAYRFTIAGDNDAVVQRGMEYLVLGLDFLGIGAKTAAGYGVFLSE